MKTKTIFLKRVVMTTILAFQSLLLSAQAPDIQWAKAYGGSQNDYCYQVKQTSDGGYLFAGSSYSNDFDVSSNYGNHDAWVVKVDASGEIEWEQNYGGTDFDRIIDFLILENNEGYVFLTQTNSNDGDLTATAHSNTKVWLFQTDLAGNITNDIVLGTVSGDYIAVGLVQADDGDFVYLSYFLEDIRMTKVDNGLFFTVWQKNFGGSGVDIPSKIRQTNDGGYIVIGYSESNDGDVGGNYGGYDVWVFKTNEFGTIEWEQNYGGSDYDYGMDIKQTTDGGFIFTSFTASNDQDVSANYGETDVWVVKINEFGVIEWEKSYGGSGDDQGTAIQVTPLGNYIISGITTSNDGDVSGSIAGGDYWVIEIDSAGNLLWQKPMGGTGTDIPWASILTNDGGILLAGQTNSNNVDVSGNHGEADFWAVKLESILGTEQSTFIGIVFYPNPATDILHIESKQVIEGVMVYDLLGKILYPHPRPLPPVGGEGRIATLDVSGLASGVYVLKVSSGGQEGTYKIVKK